MATNPHDEPLSIAPRVVIYTLLEAAPDPVDTSAWTTAVTSAFVESARDAALARDAVDAARLEAIGQPRVAKAPLTLTLAVGHVPVNLPLEPDGLLEALTALYAMDGWSAIRAASDALDEMARLSPQDSAASGASTDVYGTPAGAGERRTRFFAAPQQSSDQSGFTTESDGVEYDRRAWVAARRNFDDMREVLALAAIRALGRIEQLVDEQVVLGMNQGRNAAALAWQRYGIGDAKSESGRTERQALARLMSKLLSAKDDLSILDARAARSRSDVGLHGDRADLNVEPEEVAAKLEQARSVFEQRLADGRREHPLCAPLLLVLASEFSDEDLAGSLREFLQTLITTAESYKLPQPRLSQLLNDRAGWPEVMRRGPEAWLLDRAQPSRTFDPLTDETLLGGIEDNPALEQFEIFVLSNLKDELWRRSRGREAAAAAAAKRDSEMLVVSLALHVASVLAPPLAVVALGLDVAMGLSAALDAVEAVATLDRSFALRAQQTLAELSTSESFEAWNSLGTVLAEQPRAMDYAKGLLHVGVSVASAATIVRLIPVERLFLLQTLDVALSAS